MTCFCLRRGRKYCRTSSKARQKRWAERKRTKTQHRVISLFHAAVILLDPSIQVGAAAMFHFGTKDLADGARIRIVAITGHLARNLPGNGDSATKEPLGSRHVARLTEHRVDEIAFTIDRTVQVSTICP